MVIREAMFNADEGEFRVRYDYQPEEKPSFNYREGVGHPGCEPEVKIYEVDFGSGWQLADLHPDIPYDFYEDKLLTMLLEEHEPKRKAMSSGAFKW